MNTGFGHRSYRPESYRNLCREIQVSHSQENHIKKSQQTSNSTGPVFDNPDDPVQAFGFSVCYGFLNNGQHNDTNAFDQQKPFKNPLACIPLAFSIAYPIPTARDEFDER